jgi:diaminohydroxyphosphoribosylaminopyrimidine deaminase/5-amino-6-(5-phosphoribosylamino)uracil reductase
MIVGEGYSEPAGGRHAEVIAIAKAGERAKGSTAYVTLEPCSHYGNTPPCANAIIKAEIARVIIAVTDPDKRVSGRGIEMLRQAGIEVLVGIGHEPVTRSFEPYLLHRRTSLPYSVLKMALSIDGRSAAADGSSQWISSDEARNDVQRLRAESQAILVGSGTVLADNPRLTVREGFVRPVKPLLRVIVDSRGRINAKRKIFDVSEAPTLIATTEMCPKEVLESWKDHGVEIAVLPQNNKNQGVDLQALFELLGQKKIIQVLTEGGGHLHASMLNEGLCNRLVVYVGSCILGDIGRAAFGGLPIATLTDAPRLSLTDIVRFGNSVRLDYLAGAVKT